MRLSTDEKFGCSCHLCRNWKEQLLYLVNLSAIRPHPRVRDRVAELRRELWVHGNPLSLEMPHLPDAEERGNRQFDA